MSTPAASGGAGDGKASGKGSEEVLPQKLNMSLEDVIALDIKKSSKGGKKGMNLKRRPVIAGAKVKSSRITNGKVAAVKRLKVQNVARKGAINATASKKVKKAMAAVTGAPKDRRRNALGKKPKTAARNTISDRLMKRYGAQPGRVWFPSVNRADVERFIVMVNGVANMSEVQLRNILGVCGRIHNVFFENANLAIVSFDKRTVLLEAFQQLERNYNLGRHDLHIVPMTPPEGSTQQNPRASIPSPILSMNRGFVSNSTRTPISPKRSEPGPGFFRGENSGATTTAGGSGGLAVNSSSVPSFTANSRRTRSAGGFGSSSYFAKDQHEEDITQEVAASSTALNVFSAPSTANKKESNRGAAYSVILSNAPSDLTAGEVQDAFSCVGTVLRTEALLNSKGEYTGRFTITFQHWESAEEAVRRFDGGELNEQRIRVFLE